MENNNDNTFNSYSDYNFSDGYKDSQKEKIKLKKKLKK